MRKHFRNSSRRRGAVLILFTLMLASVIIPIVGLAIDWSIVYIVQAKLSAAVDGAALGAGRLLGTTANTTEIAGEFLAANFPIGYWGSYNLVPNIQYTQPTISSHRIAVSATVNVPALFGRILGYDHLVVPASGVATKKDSRVVMVLDRSGSMSGQIGTLQSAATMFTEMFTPGTDELGYVVFGGSALVAYPRTWPYNFSPASNGGPDTGFWDGNTTPCHTTDMVCSISQTAAGSGTGMAEGLQLAYIELQKAHNRDLLANGFDDRLNAIVLFTDGVPNMIAAYLNNPNDANYNSIKAASPCKYNPAKWNPVTNPMPAQVGGADALHSTAMIGWLGAWGNVGSWDASGFAPRASTDPTGGHNVQWWLQNPAQDYATNIYNSAVALSNCTNLPGNLPGNDTNMFDLSRIPPFDVFGNSTGSATGAYQYSATYTGTQYTGTAYIPGTTPTGNPGGYQVALAAWNLVDNIGNTVRSDATLPTIVYAIGYSGSGGVDRELLKRLANTVDAKPNTNNAQQVGKYYEAPDGPTLVQAFKDVASDILRLSQ